MTGDTWDPAKLEGHPRTDRHLPLPAQAGRGGPLGARLPAGDQRRRPDDVLPAAQRRRQARHHHPQAARARRRSRSSPRGCCRTRPTSSPSRNPAAIEKRTGADLMEQRHHDREDARRRTDLPEPAAASGQQARHGAAHRPRRRHASAPARTWAIPGVELTWKPGTDDNWVSYYEVFRNGEAIDKVAKGTYYFDHSAGADLAAKYEVRTVDGAGNVSARRRGQRPGGEARAESSTTRRVRDQLRRRVAARERSAARPRPARSRRRTEGAPAPN